MNGIKFMKQRKLIADWLIKSWYTLMKPLAIVIDRVSKKRYKRLVRACKNMSDEELIKRFAKYLIKNMIRRGETKAEFVVFNKRGFNSRNLEEEQLILAELREISHSYKDKRLKNWHYHSDKFKVWYSFSDTSESLPAYERKLNWLLKDELDRLGVKNEYIDIRKVGYESQNNKYDSYGAYLDNIGYEKTLVIHLD